MRKLITLMLGIFLAIAIPISCCQGQELGITIDLKSGKAAPIVSLKAGRTLENFLGLRVNPDVLLFAGTTVGQDGGLLGGGILAFNFRVSGGAQPVNAYAGPFMRFDDKGKAGFGLALGVRF